MDFDRLFQVINREHDKIASQMNEKERLNYFIKKINMINLYSLKKFNKLPKKYLYELVKSKRDKFVNEIGFQCSSCGDSCCIFLKKDGIIHPGIMLYEEDINILRKNNIDLSGITSLKENINSKLVIHQGMTIEEFIKLLKNAGFIKSLKLIQKQNYLQCFYFDEVNYTCRIHKYKPLICYLFPFVMAMSRNNIEYDNMCPFTAQLTLHDRIELGQLRSYIAYQVAIMLFGLYKGHIVIKDRETITVKLPPWFSIDIE